MKKAKEYKNTRFSADVIKAAARLLEPEGEEAKKKVYRSCSLSVEVNNEKWSHDSEEEFFADYRKGNGYASYSKTVCNSNLDVSVYRGIDTYIAISAPTRSEIQKIFEVFENHEKESSLPELPEPKPTVFVGHGRSQLWRDLKDHLHEKHDYPVTAYEIGARAGHAIRDILEEMLEESSFAILVMTGEDEATDGTMRARQNVIHEIGLFQGQLGFARAIVLLEEGTEEFSNIQGIDQIRFSKGNIKETFGEVLATLRREFGNQD